MVDSGREASIWKWRLSPQPMSIISCPMYRARARQWFSPHYSWRSVRPNWPPNMSIFLGLLNSCSPTFFLLSYVVRFRYFFFWKTLRGRSMPSCRQSFMPQLNTSFSVLKKEKVGPAKTSTTLSLKKVCYIG